jgi:hypothetical protein
MFPIRSWLFGWGFRGRLPVWTVRRLFLVTTGERDTGYSEVRTPVALKRCTTVKLVLRDFLNHGCEAVPVVVTENISQLHSA